MAQDLSDEQWQEVEAALYAGRKIQAIKLFSRFSGANLQQSKLTVEQHEASLHEQFPDRFTTAKASPIQAVALVLVVAAGAAYMVWMVLG